ncbi:MAG: transglycosylase domain-containing protein, partial [Deltaproteobacteria bacterium]|nr:transglycosylase domain-containing protein [Deltaproteobacteria bacterium]
MSAQGRANTVSGSQSVNLKKSPDQLGQPGFKTKKPWAKPYALWLILGLTAIFGLGVFWAFLGFFPDPLAQAKWPWTVNLVDRHNRTLAKIPSQAGYREPWPLAKFSPNLIQAVLAAEDRRFYWHLGFDPLAAGRALCQNLKAWKIVSGGSTITSQLARLVLGLYPGPRTFNRKLKELWTALLIERHHSKDEILGAYLNAVPVGPRQWGLATAALDYLGKDASRLSPAEAAFLASLPKSPKITQPTILRARQEWILGRLKDQGYLTESDHANALTEIVTPNPKVTPWLAPHFIAQIHKNLSLAPNPLPNLLEKSQKNAQALSSSRGVSSGSNLSGDFGPAATLVRTAENPAKTLTPGPKTPANALTWGAKDQPKPLTWAAGALSDDGLSKRPKALNDLSWDSDLPKGLTKATLDLDLQKEVEKMAARALANRSFQGLTQVAVVVLSLPKREILAWVGSANFFEPTEGQNDGVLALRQPGSALKPFLYQLALEEGLITAATLLVDRSISYSGVNGSFTPRNYGDNFHGLVPARVALASSLNIPAVRLIKDLGPGKVLRRLKNLGLNFKDNPDLYGLGMALGNGEVSLLALTNAYA